MAVSTLAYVELGVANVDAWVRFAVDVLGMEDASPAGAAERLLRLDDKVWRLCVRQSPANDITASGYDVADEKKLSQLAAELKAHGISACAMTPGEAKRRMVQGGIVVKDPGGLDVEIVHGLQAGKPPISAIGASFVTGDQGLGHIVISAADASAHTKFYESLGFKVSDYIETDLGPIKALKLTFFHCNARHHTLALLPLPIPTRLNHLMFEVENVDMVLAAYYRALGAGYTIVRHMGRHTNDQMLSFYVRTPAGFDVEYGCDGIQIGEQWKVKTFNAISVWGHAP